MAPADDDDDEVVVDEERTALGGGDFDEAFDDDYLARKQKGERLQGWRQRRSSEALYQD